MKLQPSPSSKPRVSLREATEQDLELIMAWRSHPKVYAGLYLQDGPLAWEEHHRWWLTRKDRKDWIIVLTDDHLSRSVGSVYAYRLALDVPEIGIYIGETTLWGKGVGAHALRLAAEWLRAAGHERCYANILDHNVASRRLFQRAGYRCVGPALEGAGARYEVDLGRVATGAIGTAD